MRLNIGAKFVAAKKGIAAKESVAFALEIKIFRQPIDFVTALFHPLRKERLLACPLLMAKIAGNEFTANRQPRIGREDHVGKSGLGRNQMDLAIQVRESGMQLFPLPLSQGRLGAAGAAHPGINLVLDTVVIRRTQKQLAHRTVHLLANARPTKIIGELSQKRVHVRDQTD
jgi:hypothetical protein